MKIYFLVEGKGTEPKVYRGWLKHLLPELSEVQGFDDAINKNFFLRAARHKSPSLTKRVEASILEANQCNYDYFVICIDAEDRSMEETQQGLREILDDLDKTGVRFGNQTAIKFVIQNRCMETWFLGNRKVFSRNPQDIELGKYIQHFNVYQNDPETMQRPANDSRFRSHAQFHEEYLTKMLSEKHIHYSKTHPSAVIQPHYLKQLTRRIQETNHLNSFRYFCDLCLQFHQEMS